MAAQGEAALQRQLQKAFKQVKQAVKTWENQCYESQKIYFSLNNLCEQFGCCKAVQIETTPLQNFEDLKQKLLIKLCNEIDGKIYQLRVILSEQETCCKKISRQRHLAFELYKKYSDQLDINTVVMRSVTQHGVADMMEWLIDSDNQLYQQFCCKEYLLDSLQYDDIKSVEKLEKSWTKNDQTVIKKINKTLDHVNLFIKEDL